MWKIFSYRWTVNNDLNNSELSLVIACADLQRLGKQTLLKRGSKIPAIPRKGLLSIRSNLFSLKVIFSKTNATKATVNCCKVNR